MAKAKFNDRWIVKTANAGDRDRVEFFDQTAHAPPLSLVVSKTGRKTFFTSYKSPIDGKTRRQKLGVYPSTSLKQAREDANVIHREVGGGVDPVLVQKAKTDEPDEVDTVGRLFERYLSDQAFLKNSRNHKNQMSGSIKRDIIPVIGSKPMSELNRRLALLPVEKKNETGRHMAAKRLFTYMKTVFNWASDLGLIDFNPLPRKFASAAPTVKRERVLTDDEIRSMWHDMERDGIPDVYCDLFKLLLLVGQRSEEISAIHRSEIQERGALNLPACRTKNSRAHSVPFGVVAQEIIDQRASDTNQEHIFPPTRETSAPFILSDNTAQVARKWQIKRGVEDRWTPHDLRRTFATRLADLGVSAEVIETLLNHVSGHRAGVAGIYNRSRMESQCRDAIERWETELMGIVT